jgi:hypothetical protein
MEAGVQRGIVGYRRLGESLGVGAVNAGPLLGVGLKAMTNVSSDVGPPGAVRAIMTVRVDGV